jgi:hypothetical protein
MPPPNPVLQPLTATRNAVIVAEIDFNNVSAQLASARALFELAIRRNIPAEINEARIKTAQLEAKWKLAQTTLNEAREKVDRLRKGLLESPPGTLVNPPTIELNGEIPTVFLPVRLETKFVPTPQGGYDLLVRIYPDDLHIDTHELGLTDAEIEAGRLFQQEASGSLANARAAWNHLVSRVGSPRAAWITKTLEESPNVHRREAAWTRAPRAALLPDYWTAVAYGPLYPWEPPITATGKLLPEVLAAGPAPQLGTNPPQNPESLPPGMLMDDGMRWLIDFKAALEVGMAIRISLPQGFSVKSLIVYGLKWTMDANSGAESLAALFDAQHYTRSLSFIPRGMPTNNTGEAPSGYDSKDLGSERSFAAERRGPLFTPGDRTNGDNAARAFGIDARIFAHVRRAGRADERAARSLNEALWAATWGYYLTRRLSGTLAPSQVSKIRSHFIEYVRGGGPLPSFRIGNQPYGVLPVTSLELGRTDDPNEVGDSAVFTLKSVRDAFRKAVDEGRVPRVTSTAPDQSLLTVLRQTAVSSAFSVRHFLGPTFLHNFEGFADNWLTAEWWVAQQQLIRSNVGSIPDLRNLTPQSTSLGAQISNPLNTPLVQYPPLPANERLSPNYIAALRAATFLDLKDDNVLPVNSFPSGRPLLYRLLHHSLLLDYADAAKRIAAIQPADILEPELIGMDDSPVRTVWDVLAIPLLFGDDSSIKISTFLEDINNESDARVHDLAATRNALKTLAGLTSQDADPLLPDTLELMLRETLDTCSHRFDAWATSVAWRHLEQLRAPTKNPRGVYIGGYGWVEDLAPTTARTSEGFLHAPSMAHATTAAVLASGYLSHRNQGNGEQPFVIDMSSERVRIARQLIRGVRQGQPLAALLGYRIERALQEDKENKLQSYIAKFRRIAPLDGEAPTPNVPLESVGANNVVNGIRILEMKRTGQSEYEKLWDLVSQDERNKVEAILNLVDNARDALGDVLMAEKVYQGVRGNFDRVGYGAEDILRGRSISEPEVLDTPRTGIAVSHKVLFFCDENAPQVAAWPKPQLEDSTTTELWVRAAAEPRLNALAAQLLPDPTKVVCRAQYVDPDNGTPLPLPNGEAFVKVQLSTLGLSPLDAVYVSSSRKPGERGELEQRIESKLLGTRPAGMRPDVRVRLDYTPVSNEVLSFSQFQLIASAVHRFLSRASAVTPGDLTVAQAPPSATTDIDEFSRRADGVATALRGIEEPLTNLIDHEETVSIGEIQTVLMRSAYLGVKTAVPVAAAKDEDERRSLLLRQVRSVLADVQTGIKKLDDVEAQVTARPDRDLRRIRAVLGSDFLAVPRLIPSNVSELKAAFSASDKLQESPRASETWLERAARVREPLNALLDVVRNAEVIMNRNFPFAVAQLPFVPGERWIALPFKDGKPFPEGRVSIVASGPMQLTADRIDAIVVDEWTEMVPNAKETTGVSFHFDQPGASAPQAMLIAVAPPNRRWGRETIEQILRETLELSKLRTVDVDSIHELQHFLPALYFALNAEGQTITTNFGAP